MALLAALSAAGLLLLPPGPAGAADVELGTPDTIDELLEAPEYASDHGDVLRLYRAFLNREPDIAGSLYWIDQFESGASLDALSFGFAQSDEFTSAYGSSLSDREFLAIVYGNILGRTPDPEGIDYWAGEMAGGLGQHGVVRWIVANDEFISRHPYSSTAPDLTPALLAATDLVGDYEPVPVPLADELDGCDTALASHPNSLASGFIDANGVFPASTLHRYATVSRARAHIARLRNDLETCIVSDPELTVADLDVGPLGDETLAVAISRLDGSDNAFAEHSVFFRHGTVVYRYVVLAPFDLGESVEATRTIATNLSTRLEGLLS